MVAGIPIFYGMTPAQLATELNIGTDAIRKRIKDLFPERPFRTDMILTAPEIAAIRNMPSRNKKIESPERGTSQKAAAIINKPAASNEVPPVKKSEPWFVLWVPILITLSSVTLTVTGLFVFAQWAGGLLGAMFSLFLFTAVMIARDNMKGDTSEQALKGVLRLEIGAAALHCFTFWRLLPQFPDGQYFFYSRVAACVILAGFAAYLSYSAVLTVRNYNAEI